MAIQMIDVPLISIHLKSSTTYMSEKNEKVNLIFSFFFKIFS